MGFAIGYDTTTERGRVVKDIASAVVERSYRYTHYSLIPRAV
jgi:hypothetical protein